ncbi:ElyC/SanA/YdcF family protein [Collinsella intestinalis]|uniref:ElyC/SanA/YdcF family protein n=1 Tax=Collinsella intestinalis TaxID=147207 RepID=UPI00195C2AD3|nr:YdcF family protein [Collinsella intestinalis]
MAGKSAISSRGLARRVLLAAMAVAALALVILLVTAVRIGAFGTVDETRPADTAIVLGAAVVGDEPTPVFAARIDHAIDLYWDGLVDTIIFTGARSPEDELSEAEAARHYALARGVPADAILLDEASRITSENIANAAQIMRRYNLESALVVSDPPHMLRSVRMACDAGIDAASSPTPTSRYQTLATQFPFIARETVLYLGYLLFGM